MICAPHKASMFYPISLVVRATRGVAATIIALYKVGEHGRVVHFHFAARKIKPSYFSAVLDNCHNVPIWFQDMKESALKQGPRCAGGLRPRLIL